MASVREFASAPTISNISRRILTGTAAEEGVGSPSKSRSYKGGKGVGEGTPRVPAGSRALSSVFCREAACSRRKLRAVFGAEVYRKSTGDRGPG
jgi:hypothetical protein